MPLHLILPLAAGVVYVVAALFLKRAGEAGASVWRTTRICNLFAALFFAPLWWLGGNMPGMSSWWQPAVVASIFLLGQILTVLALRTGDVSITTPVLGLKVVLVATFTAVLLRESLSIWLWSAAILSSTGVALMQFGMPRSGNRVGANILLAGFAAAAYALFDVLVQKYAATWSAGRFLPMLMGFAALYSLPFGWQRQATESASSKRVTVWVFAGAACLALQAVMFVSAIAIYRQAAMSNVLYSSRGLWSVLLVWMAGHWFENKERQHGSHVLAWRLVASALLMVAIVLAMRDAHVRV
jgi:drug/metabolite transporter (DMT)-like permease